MNFSKALIRVRHKILRVNQDRRICQAEIHTNIKDRQIWINQYVNTNLINLFVQTEVRVLGWICNCLLFLSPQNHPITCYSIRLHNKLIRLFVHIILLNIFWKVWYVFLSYRRGCGQTAREQYDKDKRKNKESQIYPGCHQITILSHLHQQYKRVDKIYL